MRSRFPSNLGRINMKKFLFQEVLSNNKVTLKRHDLSLARQMFEYVDKDRERLRKFLPWVDCIKTVEDEENYIRHTHEKWSEGILFDYGIFDNNDIYVGNLGVHSIRWDHDACEFGYWILGGFEGQGLMSQAICLLEFYLFSEGFNRVQIRCSDLNERSAKVPERNSYSYEGMARMDSIEMGAYRNTKTYSKLCSDYISQSNTPLIRRARYLDASGIIQAHIKSIRDICSKDYNEQQIRAWSGIDFKESIWQELMTTNHIWVIDDGKTIHGFCDLKIDGEEAEIKGLYLSPEISGRGYGKQMLNIVKKYCAKRNVTKIQLLSTITALNFYERQGFEKVGNLNKIKINNEEVECQNMCISI